MIYFYTFTSKVGEATNVVFSKVKYAEGKTNDKFYCKKYLEYLLENILNIEQTDYICTDKI